MLPLSERQLNHKRRYPRGWTLAELLVVITIIALFSIAAISSLSSNEGLESKNEKEQLLIDLIALKKESLLTRSASGVAIFTRGENGYMLSYPTLTPYQLNVISSNTNASSDTIAHTFTTQTLNNNSFMDISAGGSTFKMFSRDSRANIFAWNSNSSSPHTQFIVDTKTYKDAGHKFAFDRGLSFYFQNPTSPRQKSNEVRYMYFSPRNYNPNESDNVRIKRIVGVPLDESEKFETASCSITFNAFGFTTNTCLNESGFPIPVSSFHMTFEKSTTPATVIPSLTVTLPDDLNIPKNTNSNNPLEMNFNSLQQLNSNSLDM